MVTQTRSGTNWVKNLPNYVKCINNEKREELGWQSSFEVYFGFGLVCCGLTENRGSPEVRKVLKPTKNYFIRFKKNTLENKKIST